MQLSAGTTDFYDLSEGSFVGMQLHCLNVSKKKCYLMLIGKIVKIIMNKNFGFVFSLHPRFHIRNLLIHFNENMVLGNQPP